VIPTISFLCVIVIINCGVDFTILLELEWLLKLHCGSYHPWSEHAFRIDVTWNIRISQIKIVITVYMLSLFKILPNFRICPCWINSNYQLRLKTNGCGKTAWSGFFKNSQIQHICKRLSLFCAFLSKPRKGCHADKPGFKTYSSLIPKIHGNLLGLSQFWVRKTQCLSCLMIKSPQRE